MISVVKDRRFATRMAVAPECQPKTSGALLDTVISSSAQGQAGGDGVTDAWYALMVTAGVSLLKPKSHKRQSSLQWLIWWTLQPGSST